MQLAHPELPSCDDCEKWVYDTTTWRRKEHPPESGIPFEREKGIPTPCGQCPKCATAQSPSPEHGRTRELNTRNQQTYRAYQLLRGIPANDPIMRMNFAIIRDIERRFEQHIEREKMAANLRLSQAIERLAPRG